MRSLTGFLRTLRDLLDGLAPFTTVVASVGMLLMGVHLCAEPVAFVARTLLDSIDGVADVVMSALIRGWAGVWNWSIGERDSAIDRAIHLVDVPEKLSLVYLTALIVEGVLFFSWLKVGLNARVYLLPWERPDVAFKRWWNGRSRWVRTERVILLLVCLPAILTISSASRTDAVGLGSLVPAVTAEGPLGGFGVVAWLIVAILVSWYGMLPLLVSSYEASERAGKTRRIITLLSAPLALVSLLGALW